MFFEHNLDICQKPNFSCIIENADVMSQIEFRIRILRKNTTETAFSFRRVDQIISKDKSRKDNHKICLSKKIQKTISIFFIIIIILQKRLNQSKGLILDNFRKLYAVRVAYAIFHKYFFCLIINFIKIITRLDYGE